MKNDKKPATSQLVKRFDCELKNRLMEDLKAFKINNPFFNGLKKEVIQNLSAA